MMFNPTWLSIVILAGMTGEVLAAAKPGGDRIEFSAPKESGSVRPLTGTDTSDRRFSFERRESSPVDSQMPAGAVLPAPEDVNRTRLLLQLIERRAGGAPDDLSGSGLSLGDATAGDLGGGLGIEDILERSSRRGEGGRRGLDSGAGDGGRDASGGKDRERDGGRLPGSLGQDNRDFPARDGVGTISGGDRRDTSFLPGLDGLGSSRDDTLRTSGRYDNFLEPGRAYSRGVGSRDRDDAARYRAERFEVRQRLLGIAPSQGVVGGTTTGLGGLSGGLSGNRGAGGPPGPGSGGARTVGEMMGGGRPSTSAPSGLEPGAMDASFALPSARGGFDLGLGQAANGKSVLDRVTPSTPAPKPMELFQRKHDSRIPTRGF
jgi:hypothetical protein